MNILKDFEIENNIFQHYISDEELKQLERKWIWESAELCSDSDSVTYDLDS